MRLKDRDLMEWVLDWMAREGYRVGAKGVNRENLSMVVLGNGSLSRQGVFLELTGREECPALDHRAALGLPTDTPT